MTISPVTPSFGFGVTPGFGLNPVHGVSATPPRTEVDLATPAQGVQTFGQVLARQIEAYGPAAAAGSQPVARPAALDVANATQVTMPGAAFGLQAVAPDAVGQVAQATTVGPLGQSTGAGLGAMVSDKLGELGTLHARSDALATAAATGDLKDIHEYTIAANEASVATQLAVSVRDKALQAFNDIIRMQL